MAGRFLCEWKYDGERCQVHLVRHDNSGSVIESRSVTDSPSVANSGAVTVADGASVAPAEVRLFSRSMDGMNERFPDVLEIVPRALRGVTSAIIDAELCAVDRTDGRLLPFQTLSSRARKAPTTEQVSRAAGFAYKPFCSSGQSRSILIHSDPF